MIHNNNKSTKAVKIDYNKKKHLAVDQILPVTLS